MLNEQFCFQAIAQLSVAGTIYVHMANNGKLDEAWGTKLVTSDSVYKRTSVYVLEQHE